MADLPIPRGDPGTFDAKVFEFLAKGHDSDGDPFLGTPRILTADKTIHAGRSLVVSGFYRIEEGVTLRIEADAELTIV